MTLHTPQTNASQSQSNEQTQNQQTGGFRDFGSPSFGLPNQLAGTGSGGGVFEKLMTRILAEVKSRNENDKSGITWGAHKLLKQTAGLNYSCIVVSETANGLTAAHVLIIEKTGDYPDKLSEQFGGQRYEIIRTPGDALDAKCITQTQLLLSNALKIQPKDVVVADGTLVPSEFDMDNETGCNDLINNTFNACHVEIAVRVQDYKGKNLANLASTYRNGKFVIALYFNGDDAVYFDQTGLPVRQDICVVLSFKSNQGEANSRSIHQSEDTIEIVRTYGYIDFEFTGPVVINGVLTTQKFIPNFVITHVESARVAPTPDIVMLGVASVISLKDDMNWMQSFRAAQTRKGQTDFNDIGGLNIEGNIEQSPTGFGKRYDTKSKTTTVIEINKLVSALVHPTMAVSIDVPKAGPETWYMSVFQHIQMHKDKNAIRRVADFMTQASNGAFSIGNIPMFTENTNKIHGGFYKAEDGYRDIRHLSSYLAVANHVADTNQSPAVVQQYTNTLYNTNIPDLLRAATRMPYIVEMSKRSAHIKQMYDRLTFNTKFLETWVNALTAVNFNPVFSSTGGVNDMFVKRNTANFSSAMLSPDLRLMTSMNQVPGWIQYGDYQRPY